MSKIIITGSSGFIGSHLSEKLKDHDLFLIDSVEGNDLTDLDYVKNLPDCDLIIHLAAINGTKLFYEIPTKISFNNTLPIFYLIDRYKNSKTKFIFSSTCEIFNGTIDNNLYPVPTDESVPIMFNDIRNPRWSYSLPKALGENLLANCGLDYLILRYFNVYGPRQKDHFIQEFVERVKKGEYYINGNDTRSFCYIDDAINITELLIQNCSKEIVNIGSPVEHDISYVAQMIMDIMGINPNKLEIFPSPKGSAKRRCPSVKKMLTYTNYVYQYDLRKGLECTLKSL